MPSCYSLFMAYDVSDCMWVVWDMKRLQCGMLGMWDAWNLNVHNVECVGYRILKVWNVWDVSILECGILAMWEVHDVECLRCGKFEMWDFGNVGYLWSAMSRIWDVWDVGYLGCEMFKCRMWNVWHVGRLRCGLLEGWDIRGVRYLGCGMWDVCWDTGCRFTKCHSYLEIYKNLCIDNTDTKSDKTY